MKRSAKNTDGRIEGSARTPKLYESLTRREFIKASVVAAFGFSIYELSRKWLTPLFSPIRPPIEIPPNIARTGKWKVYPEYFKGISGAEWAMVIDLEKCIGCGACVVACSRENSKFLNAMVPLGARTRIAFIEYGGSKIPFHFICRHCDPAPCVEVCPTGASIKREDGIVVIDYDLCIGCKYCMTACPYGARYENPFIRAIDKCTFCAHRVDKGEKPACVAACPVKARMFINLASPEEARLIEELKAAGRKVTMLKAAGIRKTHVYYVFPSKSS